MIFKEVQYGQLFRHRKLGLMRKDFRGQENSVTFLDGNNVITISSGAVKLNDTRDYYPITDHTEIEPV